MWYIYILLCEDSSFYTGSTNDVNKRLQAHIAGNGAKYTKSHKPKKLVYEEAFLTKKEAMQREWEIKKWPRKKKELLISRLQP